MTPKQQAQSLVDYFDLHYKDKYGRKYTDSARTGDIWSFRDIVEDMGYERTRALIYYYFKLKINQHSRTWFIYNYNDLNEQLVSAIEDGLHRRKMRAKTQQRMEEMNEA